MSSSAIAGVLSGQRQFALVQGDVGHVILEMPRASVDAVIIDPPGGKGVFGKAWDASLGGRDLWIRWLSMLLEEHRLVLKPGRLAFIWSYPKTSHWTGTAIEDAGFEIIDCFFHLFSHRRPTSRNLPKAACEMWWMCRAPQSGSKTPADGSTPESGSRTPKSGSRIEPGIDACRIPAVQSRRDATKPSAGRHATSVILSHSEPAGEPCAARCVVHDLDEMSGQLRSGTGAKVGKSRAGYRGNAYGAHCRPEGTLCTCYGDEGGASRFFSVLNNDPPFLYCNRASRSERNAGLPEGTENEGVAVKPIALMRHLVRLANVPANGIVLDGFAGTGSTGCACALEGVRFIGVENDKNDAAVARSRIAHCYSEVRR